MKIKKSQASLEMLFGLAIILALFIGVILFFANRDSETVSTADFLEKKNLCNKIANNINNVYTNGDGAIIRLDDNDYTVYFDGIEKTVFVDDVGCTIPTEEITNGVHNKFFVSPGIIQMENRDNVVYIGSNCFLDVPTKATATSRDPNNRITVTNLVRKDDNVYADVYLPHIFSYVIDDKREWIESNDIRIAYIRLGSECSQEILEQGLIDDYDCKEMKPADLCENCQPGFCDLYKDNNLVPKIFEKNWQKNYTIMIFEDPELANDEILKLEQTLIDPKLKNKWFYVIERLHKENVPKNIFNVDFFRSHSDGDAPAIVQDYEDRFFQLTPGNRYYEGPPLGKDMAGVKNTTETEDYLLIGNFSSASFPLNYEPGVDSIAKWFYGFGSIYYASECNDDVAQAMTDGILELIGAYALGNLEAEFDLTFPLGQNIEPETSKIFLSHYEDSVNVTIANITYSDINGDFLACEDINGTLTERLDNCPHDSKEQSIKTNITFFAGLNDIKRAAHVDVEYIETCFNPEDIFG